MSEQQLPDFPKRKSLTLLTASLLFCAMPGRSWAIESQQQLQSFVVFINLSRILTGTDDLDLDFGKRIFTLIAAEPWGMQHLAQLAEKLQVTPSSGTMAERDLSPDRFTSGERWFINHLLTSWVTGIYYHEVGNQVVTYQHALMYSALRDVRAVHGQCGGEFGFWSAIPAGIEE